MNELQICSQFLTQKLNEILDIPVFNGIQEEQDNLNTYCVFFINSIKPVKYISNTQAFSNCDVYINIWSKNQYAYALMEDLNNKLDGQQGAVINNGADIGYVSSCIFKIQQLIPLIDERWYDIQAQYTIRVTDTNGTIPDYNNYETLSNKPSINGVVLQGNKTTEELNIDMSGKVDKVTTTADNDRVYIVNGDGEQGTLIADRKGGGERGTADVIVKRTYNGNIWLPNIADINNPNYATSKEYVDTALLSKQDIENWELINTADFSETGVDTVEFTVDSENNPFELKNYKLIIELLESNGNRCHIKTTGMSSSNYFYLNASAVALYRTGGQQVIIEPAYSYDKILDIKNTCPPPTCLYAESQAPQWLNYYTYNGAVVKSKSDLFPIKGVKIELQNAVKGKIYLYGVRND